MELLQERDNGCPSSRSTSAITSHGNQAVWMPHTFRGQAKKVVFILSSNDCFSCSPSLSYDDVRARTTSVDDEREQCQQQHEMFEQQPRRGCRPSDLPSTADHTSHVGSAVIEHNLRETKQDKAHMAASAGLQSHPRDPPTNVGSQSGSRWTPPPSSVRRKTVCKPSRTRWQRTRARDSQT